MNDSVLICEVGLRDGLQNEAMSLTLADKQQMFDSLVAAGLRQIEIGSFVSPKAVPAMADTDALARAIQNRPHASTRTLGLIMNEKGLDRAMETGVDGVCIVTVVSETLCLKNNRCTSQESIDMAQKLLQRAKAAGLFVRIDVATAWVCPYEGAIALDQVQRLADQLWEYQPDELAFCDSIGFADPLGVDRLFAVFGDRYDRSRLVAHFHDTKAMGLANATAALLQGIRRFDASLGGLGGCPFAPGAKGNLATEDLVHLCESSGFSTGIQVESLWSAIDVLEARIGRSLGGQTKTWFQSRSQT